MIIFAYLIKLIDVNVIVKLQTLNIMTGAKTEISSKARLKQRTAQNM